MKQMISSGIALTILISLAGCGSTQTKSQRDFYTSGSRDADQRAAQRIAKDQQTRGESASGDSAVKKSLYDRLGGEQGIQQIVDDFVTRAMADPRVNFERKGVRSGLTRHNEQWDSTPENVAKVKAHITQFISLATGGPSKYEGRDMKEAHAGMKISNSEFDASVGDLKVTLDKFAVGTTEQKELLSIIESTRTEIVEER